MPMPSIKNLFQNVIRFFQPPPPTPEQTGAAVRPFPAPSPLIYSLESPKYHLFDIQGNNIFTGWVFYFGDQVITHLAIYLDDQLLTHIPVNLPRPDIASYVTVPAAQHCGFSFILSTLSESTRLVKINALLDNGDSLPFLIFDINYLKTCHPIFVHYKTQLETINKPNEELVYLTQGHTRVDEYQNNIIPAVLNMQRYLSLSGIKLSDIKSLLDFGCGSGRLLVGWHIISPEIRLEGCDVNQRLIQWAQTSLPPAIHCQQNQLQPPLPYQNQAFDFIYLISVFTHLSLNSQQQWLNEFKRILRIGGYLLVTLQGELYVRNTFHQQPEKIEEFNKRGFVTTGQAAEEGLNQYGAYHHPGFVERLFTGFKIIGYFPCGNVGQQHTLFQIAQSQDVYVLRYEGEG